VRSPALFMITCIVLAIAGCATSPITPVCLSSDPMSSYRPIASHDPAMPTEAVSIDESVPSSLDQPRRPRRIARAATPDSADNKKASAQTEPARYSQEWWDKQERADDKLKPKLIICRGC
jgi:hypothetical protein